MTLLELIIVVVVIGVLVSLGIPQLRKLQETALDKEAMINLRLIQAAENIYKMKTGNYFQCSSFPKELCIQSFNNTLNLNLPVANPNWYYQTATEFPSLKLVLIAERVTDGRGCSLYMDGETVTCTPP